ncbi:MAG: insulinase family protein [Bradymonadaceae bacterium]|nr:insulinase family protein [Lujinxingiaceae bacterium]
MRAHSKLFSFLLILAGCASSSPTTTATPDTDSVERVARAAEELPQVTIPSTMFVLDNGLRVVVHEDRKAPVVAVNVWYHVGSKDEQLGRTGFAHLFEHLMFQGSENYGGEYFEPLEEVGATDMNGTTNRDRTNYFQTVPTPALDVALFMESDRMGHFQGAITQKLLDEQREVVKNEKRQRVLNQPYGRVWQLAAALSYPAGHPYSWSTIGSMADLDAATLADVKGWFGEYYGAANAVLTIAGDISPEEARARAEKYFGHIAPGPTVAKKGRWIAPMTEHRRHVMHDKVSQSRVYRVYNVPQWGSAEVEQLRIATLVLGSGKNSRLYKRLVYDEQIATDVVVFLSVGELGSQLWAYATAKDGVALERVEAALDEEFERFKAEGPSTAEIARARTVYFASLVNQFERVGGRGKADTLAMSTVFGGSPDAFQQGLEYLKGASADDIRNSARKWLSDGSLTLEVHPQPSFVATSSSVDRSTLPKPQGVATLSLPPIERATLSNGIEVIVQTRHDAPVVQLKVLVNGGYAADRLAQPGAMKLLGAMLDEGTPTRSSLEIAAALEDLGAQLSTGSSLDNTEINLAVIKPVFAPALDILVDVLRNPTLPENELERLRKITLAAMQREKMEAMPMGLRLLGPLIFGKDHPYGIPLTGSGYEEVVAALDRDSLLALHDQIFVPANVRIIAAGDITLGELTAALEARLGDWQKAGTVLDTSVPQIAARERPEVVIIDRPGAAQSIIIAGHVVAARGALDQTRAELFNDVFGGTFTARINMNLREDKGWSYGARSQIWSTLGQQIFMTYAGVQSDKTAESMAEIDRELREILDTRPPTALELSRMQDRRALRLPGQNESSADLLSSVSEVVKFGLPDDHLTRYVQEIRAADVAALQAIGPEIVQPERLLWIVVGDRASIEAAVRALELGEVRFMDADANPL